MKKIVVYVGSTSALKLESGVEAARLAEIPDDLIRFVTVKTESGVNEQPIGTTEITDGALNRAHGALDQAMADAKKEKIAPDEEVYVIGIENGIMPQKGQWRDLADCHMLWMEGDILVEMRTWSRSVPVPEEAYTAMREQGANVTHCGAESARLHGHPKDNPHFFWSGDKDDRKGLLVEAMLPMFRVLKRRMA